MALSLSDADTMSIQCDLQVKIERDGWTFVVVVVQLAISVVVNERMRQQTEPIWIVVRCAFYKLANLSFRLNSNSVDYAIHWYCSHMVLIGRIDVRINRKISSPWPSRSHQLQFCDTQKLLIKQSHSITLFPSFGFFFSFIFSSICHSSSAIVQWIAHPFGFIVNFKWNEHRYHFHFDFTLVVFIHQLHAKMYHIVY